jgi:hypothetical protein
VVNADCRSWDIPNLWVCDGSIFPTTGGVNPSLNDHEYRDAHRRSHPNTSKVRRASRLKFHHVNSRIHLLISGLDRPVSPSIHNTSVTSVRFLNGSYHLPNTCTLTVRNRS